MREYRIEGEGVRRLLEAIGSAFANNVRKAWSVGEDRFHLMVGTKHFLRTGSSGSLTVVAHEEASNRASLFVVATGAETGLWGVTWGAHEAYEEEFERMLLHSAEGKGLQLIRTHPAPFPPTTPPPKRTEIPRETQCPKCGMRGPTDKGECYYCGAKLRL